MLDKNYDPHQIETQWYQRWEAARWFEPSAEAGGACLASLVIMSAEGLLSW